MRHRSAVPFATPLLALSLAAGAVIAGAAGPAGAAPIYDQSGLGGNSFTAAYYYIANDFTVANTTLLTRATIWMMDLFPNCGDGELDDLGPTLGWAVYQDASGSVGTLVGSGVGTARVVADAGFDLFSCDVLQVRFETTPPLTLAPGTYWFAIHDGAWGDGYDNTNVFWVDSDVNVGSLNQFAEATTKNPPQNWAAQDPGHDQAFVLEGPDFTWDQGAYDGTDDGLDINTFAGADDFTLATTTSFSAIDAWIEDLVGNDNGVVEGFDGELSWAIFANDQNLPGGRLADGVATAAWVQNLDVQSIDDTDTARVHLPLGRSVTLEPGTYWLGLHEGDWPGDPTGASIRWGGTSAPAGLTSAISDPGADAFEDGGGLPDYAFQLYEEPLFSSGFEAGTTCAWQPGGGDCP